MISKIKGIIHEFKDISVILDVHGVCYEIFLPRAIQETIEKSYNVENELVLTIYHFIQTDPSRSIPILIGFQNEVEKEFFEKFITVSGVGPRAAVKALSLSFSTIAQAIHESDIATLKSLPGIGQQRAREIIAKLQGKMGKFGLIQDQEADDLSILNKKDTSQSAIADEAILVLLQLQYSKSQALKMVENAMQRNEKLKSCEEILNEVYRQKVEA